MYCVPGIVPRLEIKFMESFKIEHFLKTHNGLLFPWHRSLTADETEVIQRRLLNDAKIVSDTNTPNLDLVFYLVKKGEVHSDFNAQDKDFNLIAVLDNLEIRPQPNVFVNWYRFDKVDQIRLADLAQYFDDIWYPSSDDIDIFDEDLSWILSVSHDGELRVTYFGKRKSRTEPENVT